MPKLSHIHSIRYSLVFQNVLLTNLYINYIVTESAKTKAASTPLKFIPFVKYDSIRQNIKKDGVDIKMFYQ